MSKKISQLTAVVTPLGTDQLEVNQGGTSKRATITQITSIEAAARIAADGVLTTNLATEVTNRTNADTALGVLIGNSINKNGSVAFTANQSLAGFKLTNLGAATTNGDAVRYQQAVLVNGANAMTGALNMGSQLINSVADPVSAQDAVTLAYLKTQNSWNKGANATTKTLNSNSTITVGTDNNIVYFGGSTVTANRSTNIVTSATLDNNVYLYFIGFNVSAGNTFTINVNGSPVKVFTAGTHNATCIAYINGTIVEQPWFYPSDSTGLFGVTYPVYERIYTAVYDYDNSGGAVGSINLTDAIGNNFVLPEGSIILHNKVIIETVTPFTSGGAATVAWGYTGTAAAFDAATGFGSAPYTTANLVKAGSVTAPEKLTATKQLTMTVATADLTAGKAYIHIPVILNKF